MAELANSGQSPDRDVTGNENLPDDLKNSIAAMMTEMMTSFKQDLLAEFEDYFSSPQMEGDLTDTITPTDDSSAVATAVDNCINADAETASPPSSFADLAAELQPTNLVLLLTNSLQTLSANLCRAQLPKAKLDGVLENYPRPQNCDHLVSP